VRLIDALGVRRGDVVSFVGGGGKTSLALCLAQEAAALGWKAVFTVTAKIKPPALPVFASVESLEFAGGPVCLAGPLRQDGKLAGVSYEEVAAVAAVADLVSVEADGSAGRSLKFPQAHEPVIPTCSTIVVPVAGASVVGRAISPELVHRSSEAAEFVGSDVATPSVVARLLWHPDAATRGRPSSARVVPAINQADSVERLAAARAVAAELIALGAPLVLLTAAQSDPPVIELVVQEGS